MNILLYREFSKRRNSTKQPINVESVSKDVKLKDKCSILNPHFFLADAEQYVYLKAWDYYYFIDSVEYDINGASYITCTIDVLASFKSAILGTSAFVKYSSSDYDENIIDNRITQLITSDFDVNEDVTLPLFNSEGCYIITVTNDNIGVTNYCMSRTEFNAFTAWLTDLAGTIVGDIIDQFQSIMNSIHTVRWLPISKNELPVRPGGEGAFIEIGKANISTITGNALVDEPLIVKSTSLAIPWKYTDFRRYSTFTTIYLTLPFVGKVEIDPLEIVDNNELYVSYIINVTTGSAVVIVNVRDGTSLLGRIIGTYSATLGRTLPISITSIDGEGALAGAIALVTAGTAMGAEAAAGLLTEGLFLEHGRDMLKGELKGVLAQVKGTTTSVGTYGGTYYEYLIPTPTITVISKDTRTTPSEVTELYGRPCNKVLQIGTLSGYVETTGFSINIPSLLEIKNLINKYMDNGIYLE